MGVAVQGLWESLSRAGPHLGGIQELENTEPSVTFIIEIVFPLPKNFKQHISGYAREYMQACGWHVRAIQIREDHVVLIVDNV